jgi:acetyltransferase-like isoleucine patch superfamily enzyme
MGRRVRLEKIPAISGNVRVHLGDDVDISGRMAVNGGRVFPESTLRIGNRSFIGHMSTFMICREIVIGDDVLLAQGCYIADNSAHPLDADRRAMGSPPDPDSVRPVHIGNKVWVGRQSMILPGVTIGEGAVIGASSVVTKDIPPHTVWAGNPAKFIRSLVTNNTAASLEKV